MWDDGGNGGHDCFEKGRYAEHPSSKILVVDDGVENRQLIALVLAERVFGWKKQRTGSRRSTKLNKAL
jgi:hypothetical protein